jgi:predicted ATPase/DNA-binding SARP family transcriptional activator
MPSPRNRTSRPGSRLPVALTPLLGRARELEETGLLLRESRLLTITGAGGSGKTRLALELAHRERDRFEEAYWVDLAPLSDPDLVARQFVEAMRVRDLSAEDMLQVVIDSIRDRAVLFVLDNCEHLVEAVAVVVEEVLRNCPGTTAVVTSREALGIAGEQTWLVPPLRIEDAVQLFEQRAHAVLPSFTVDATNSATAAAICQRLDGIPLAIELAAARIKVLSLDEIAARLSDAFALLSSGPRTLPRHRTIRETIDWSFRLLSGHEQTLFRRLSVFTGSFTLAAAEAVCGEAEVLSHLSALVAKSLVIAEDGRYRLLDTVRQFASEKLIDSGEELALRYRHATYFVDLVEEAEPTLFAGGEPVSVRRIDREIDNIRGVFDAAVPTPDRSELVLRLVYALHWYWFARGDFREARRRIDSALERNPGRNEIVRAKAIVASGNAAVWQADWAALEPPIAEAIATLRGGDDLRALAVALMLDGIAAAFAKGDHARATRTFAEAEEIARKGVEQNGLRRPRAATDPITQVAPPPGAVALALTLYWSGLAAQLREDWTEARAAFEEALQIGVSFGSRQAIGHPSTALGHLALHEGRTDEAIERFRRALDTHHETGDRWGLTHTVEGIGLTLLAGGHDVSERDRETGTRLLAAASAAWLHIGARPGRESAFEEEKSSRIRDALSDERLRVVLASGAAMAYEDMVALAREQLDHIGSDATEESHIQVRALGPLQILRDEKPVEEAARSRELLLFLLTHRSGRTKEQIGAAIWPDADPARLRNNFHVTLHRLRKMLGGPEWISVDGETYALDRRRRIDFDAETFEREATAALRSSDVNRLAAALELYRGEFFENATAGEWYLETRARLQDVYARALDALGRARTRAGDHESAALAWRRLVELDELDEDAARHLIEALVERGDRAGALRVWRRLADALERELGERPSFPAPRTA